MTAAIVKHHNRAPFPPAGLGQPRPATLTAGKSVPGQLWEREAERGESGVVNSPNYSARIADAFRELSGNAAWRGMAGGSERGERVCSAIVDCGRHLCFVGTLNGNDLRAWRVGAARPYIAQHVHTGFEAGAL